MKRRWWRRSTGSNGSSPRPGDRRAVTDGFSGDQHVVVKDIPISDGEIRLGQLLKLADLVGAGSAVRPLLAAGTVSVNDVVETRRGRRLRPGDVVDLDGQRLRVTSTTATGAHGATPRGPDELHRVTPSQQSSEPALGRFELGDPGPMRDRLVAAVLRGEKTATSTLEVFYELEGQPRERVGARSELVDSAGSPCGEVEVTDVTCARLVDVGDDVARAEGEGFANASEWRQSHEHYWNGYVPDVRRLLHRPEWVLDDSTSVVVVWFRLLIPTLQVRLAEPHEH